MQEYWHNAFYKVIYHFIRSQFLIIISIMHIKSPFLSILVAVAYFCSFISPHILTTLSNNNFACIQQYLHFSQNIPITVTGKFIIVDSIMQHNRGDLIVRIYPTRESTSSAQTPIINNIIQEMKAQQPFQNYNFTAKSKNNYQNHLDLQSLYTYSNRSIIKIKNDQIGNKIVSLLILFYRINQNKIRQNDLFPCTDNVISYIVSSSDEASCPTCSTQHSLAPFLCSDQGFCICRVNYIGRDCELTIIRLYLKQEDQRLAYPRNKPYQYKAKPMSRQHYYFTHYSETSKLQIIFQQPQKKLKFLKSTQIISDEMPQITTANIYNYKDELQNPFTLKTKQNLLITIVNKENQQIPYILKIQEQQPFPVILKIILILIGVILFILIICIIACYITYILFKLSYDRTKITIESQYPQQLFPSIRFYQFKLYILQNSACQYYLYNKIQSSLTRSLWKNNPDNTFNDNSQQRVCSICLQEIQDDSIIKYTFCNHIHDAKCLDEWMNRQANCPLCRQPFDLLSVFEWRNKIKQAVEKFIHEQQQSLRNQNEKNFETGQFNETINYFTETYKKEYNINKITQSHKQILGVNSQNHKVIKRGQNQNDNEKKIKKQKIENFEIFLNSNEQKNEKKTIQPSKNRKLQDSQIKSNLSDNRKSLILQDQGIDEKTYRYYKSIWLFHKKKEIEASYTSVDKKQKETIVDMDLYQNTIMLSERPQQQPDKKYIRMRKRQAKTSANNYQPKGWTENLYSYQLENINNDFQQSN